MKFYDVLVGFGVIGVVLLVLCLLLVPLFVTVVVGVALANYLGLTGLLWWCFVVLFYLVIGSLIGSGGRGV